MKKIFLIGRRRTGIQTTIKALTIMGYKRSKILTSTSPDNNIDIETLISKMKTLDVCGILIDYTLGDIKAIEAAYPDSTFVLNKRDSSLWYSSFVRYFSKLEGINSQSAYKNKGHYITSYYEKFNNDVAVHFDGRAWKLFTLNLNGSHSWQGICSYLKKPIPSVSFPHENRSLR
jgi:hypothetical protein|tara:strand:- start:487 stop:1008 length:522 start_codon:yes stop_codon:yes gene_type:complete